MKKLLILLLLPLSAFADVTFNWTAPVAVAGADITGFEIHYGSTSGAYTDVISVNDPTATSYIASIPDGVLHAAMVSTSIKGLSAFSNEVVCTVDQGVCIGPNPPGVLTVQ